MNPVFEGRVLVPKDVFVQLCVDVKKLSDIMLVTVVHLKKDAEFLSEANNILQQVLLANIQLGHIEGMLRAIVEDDMPASPKGPGGLSHA